ncbi:MAG TPA: hypothetical protein VMA77_25665 [Solirubrobacteraceae bacterium]|nr:hypothetical protein [Solirubrobacteraceae bacterium]
MHLHRCLPVVAAVVSLAGATSAPAALASEAMAPGGGGTVPPTTTTVVQHHSAGSVDWIVGIGTATGIVILGTGALATRRNRRLTAAGSGETRVAS